MRPKKQLTYKDQNVQYSFREQELINQLKSKNSEHMDEYHITSSDRKAKLTLKTETERCLEFIKLLACCHECSTVRDKDTNEILYYQVYIYIYISIY